LHVAEPKPAERRAHLGKIRQTAFRLNLDQRAAHEVDAEIEPVKKVEQDGEDRQRRGRGKTAAATAHEIKLGVVWDAPQQREIRMKPHVSHRKSPAAGDAPISPTKPRSAALG